MTFTSLANYFMYPLGSNLEGKKHVKYFLQGDFGTRREERLTVNMGRGGRQRFPAVGTLSSPGEGTRGGDDAPTVWFPRRGFAAGAAKNKDTVDF